MFMLYDLLFLIIAIIYLPVYLIRRKFHRGFTQRLGFLPAGGDLKQPIWIHAVSVGEAISIKGLVAGLKKSFPDTLLAISTVTSTGNAIARSLFAENNFVFYLPLDFSFIVSRVVKRISARLCILVETELWPNLINCLYQRGVPIVVVNARISDVSFRRYRRVKFLLQPTLSRIRLFCVQGLRDAQRLKALGVRDEKIRITGNMKFDIYDYPDFPAELSHRSRDPASWGKKDYSDLQLKFGLQGKLFVAGSTHPGEEEIVLKVYKNLLRDFADLRLLIAPRHPARTEEVEKIAQRYGFESARISQPTREAMAENRKPRTENREPILILDTVGQLLFFYALANIVFVGGSLVKKGGHNILEPVSLGKPVLFGPHMFNFRDIACCFFENDAAVLVKDEEELLVQARALLLDSSRRQALAEKGLQVLVSHRGATQKNLGYIRNYA